jgi:hypothetical protein
MAPAPWPLIEAGQAMFAEALAPLADDLSRCIEAGGNDIICEPLCREEHDLGSDDIPIQ